MKKIARLTILLFIVSCVSTYLIIFQSYHSYGAFLAAVCLFLIFASILVLQFLWIDVTPGSIWTSSIRTVATILLMVPIAYGLIKTENSYENKNLDKYGVHALELISYTYKTSSSKSGVAYHAVYQYTVAGETYTQKLSNNHDVYHVGDTVEIVYSLKYPQIDKIVKYRSKRTSSVF